MAPKKKSSKKAAPKKASKKAAKKSIARKAGKKSAGKKTAKKAPKKAAPKRARRSLVGRFKIECAVEGVLETGLTLAQAQAGAARHKADTGHNTIFTSEQ